MIDGETVRPGRGAEPGERQGFLYPESPEDPGSLPASAGVAGAPAEPLEHLPESTHSDASGLLASPQAAAAELGAVESASFPQATRMPRILRSLRNRDFRYFWAGNFLSNIGTWMQNIAQGWLVLQLSGSVFWLGAVSFAAAAPMLMFALIGGVIADNVNKRRLLLVTQTAMMIFAFILAGLSFAKIITVRQILFLAFANGLATALNMPSYQAMVPQLVPAEDLTNAIAINSAQFNLSRVLGPTLGGFAMAWFGVSGTFFLNGLSFLAVIFALATIHYPDHKTKEHGKLWELLTGGFRYAFSNPQNRTMKALFFLLCFGSFFAVPYLSFTPYFARDVLHAGERGLGVLMGCSGLGAFLGAVTIAYVGEIRSRGRLVAGAGAASFISIIVYSLSHSFLLSALMQMSAGYFMILMVATTNTLLQQLSSDEMRGRVMSIYVVVILGLAPTGSLIVGALAHLISAPRAIALMSLVALVSFGWIYWRRAELQQLD